MPGDLTEELRKLLGLDELRNELVGYLDRIERHVARLNITPADLDALEQARLTLEGSDATIDAIEPETGENAP